MFRKGACTASSQIYCFHSALFEVEDMCRHTVEAECLQGLKGLFTVQATVQLQVFAGVKGIVGRGEFAASKCCGLADFHQCNTFASTRCRETAKRFLQ